MKVYHALFVLPLALVGCASQIMAGYVGKPITEPMLDYGPPANAVDLGENKRAFQWAMRSTFVTPVTATTNAYGSSSWITSNTMITGGQPVTSECLYTLTATWNTEQKQWYVDGYRQPRMACE